LTKAEKNQVSHAVETSGVATQRQTKGNGRTTGEDTTPQDQKGETLAQPGVEKERRGKRVGRQCEFSEDGEWTSPMFRNRPIDPLRKQNRQEPENEKHKQGKSADRKAEKMLWRKECPMSNSKTTGVRKRRKSGGRSKMQSRGIVKKKQRRLHGLSSFPSLRFLEKERKRQKQNR